ncbi:hypothetical protein SteCoe_19267 [Stentor coeruleus]|uniref:Uncharacterized protein n=1 Tax=Stentor coeruleus TaxID=5963 RepID=A0A1R2BUM6_9CILI|nr:hypothetical protein SteCoe_19267 [Stentor coeruleus]
MDQETKCLLDESEPGQCFSVYPSQEFDKNLFSKIDYFKTIKEKLAPFFYRSKKPLKKEYVRANIIRLHKKNIRMIMSNKKSLRRMKREMALFTDKQAKAFERFKDFTKNNWEIMSAICPTESGPMTDGKARRKGSKNKAAKSFNDTYVRDYFADYRMRESFSYFIDYIFAEENSSLLVSSLNYFCCLNENHSEKCISHWLGLKEFYQVLMIDELNIIYDINSSDIICENEWIENIDTSQPQDNKDIVDVSVIEKYMENGYYYNS